MSAIPTSTPSVYQELNHAKKETRLIIIEPGSREDVIRCTMRTFSLSQTPLPAYETISYVWGDAALRGTVFVNESRLDVPLSAEVVLRRVRDAEKKRTVWIDSLCIDQMNMDDRNYQVQLMRDIYSSTVTGLIWLGQDDGNAESISKSLDALYDEARHETDDFRSFKNTVWPGWWDSYGPLSAVQYNAEHMAAFFDLPWFSRLWVVQEASLAARSICYYGSHAISLLLILRASIWLYSKSKSSQGPLSGHTGLARAVHIASYTDELFEMPFRAKNNLLWMLNTLKQYDTSRDEDHVYGLVGMYQQFLLQDHPLPQRLIPNYGRPLKYVLCNATKLAIEELRRLDPLLYACHRTTDELERDPLPSWVPKWHRKQNLHTDHFPLNYGKFAASQESDAWIQPAETDLLETLIVTGFPLDTVEDLTEPFSHAALHNDDQLLSLFKSAERLLAGVTDGLNSLANALVASLDHRMNPMSQEQSTVGYNALLRHLSEESTLPPPSAQHEVNVQSKAAKDYREALVRWMRNRRLFITRLGYIGTAPQVIEQRDLVAILNGSRMPIALRPMEKAYAVVGQAYISGVMAGEAVEAHKGKGEVDARFALV